MKIRQLMFWGLAGLILNLSNDHLALAAKTAATSAKTEVAVKPAAAADEDAGLEDNMSYHLYDDIDLVSTLKFEYGKPRIIIKSVFPQLVSDTDNPELIAFNEAIVVTIKDAVTQFRQKVKDNEAIQKTLPKTKISNNLYIDYNSAYVRAKKQHLISIRYSIQGYIGGMNDDFHYHQSFNYNVDQMQPITLSDLFIEGMPYLQTLSEYARQALYQRFRNHEKVREGTMPEPENFAIWNIQPDGLLFTFESSKVSDKTYGTQTVFVPYRALETILNPESPLMECASSKTRCLRNNLLTGGFIDEA